MKSIIFTYDYYAYNLSGQETTELLETSVYPVIIVNNGHVTVNVAHNIGLNKYIHRCMIYYTPYCTSINCIYFYDLDLDNTEISKLLKQISKLDINNYNKEYFNRYVMELHERLTRFGDDINFAIDNLSNPLHYAKSARNV